jgi:hypothetical protein
MIVTIVNTLNVLANARKSRGDGRPKVSRGVQMKQRGVFEKVQGSGIWWICYFRSVWQQASGESRVEERCDQTVRQKETASVGGQEAS